MCKKIGAVSDQNQGDLKIKALEGLSDKECANAIAQHFASVSNLYEPVNLEKLPAFLPSLPSPQVDEYDVYLKLKKLNNTKGTLPIDLPNRLRNEIMVELAAPLTNIINTCLTSGSYPALWKREWVTPVPKINDPIQITDVRKISGTSDFNKVFESIIKDILIEDIYPNFDVKQYGGKKGMGTAYMLVALMDRVQKLLDNNNTTLINFKFGPDLQNKPQKGETRGADPPPPRSHRNHNIFQVWTGQKISKKIQCI